MPNLFENTGAELPATYGNLSLIRTAKALAEREAELKEQAKAARERVAPQGQMVSGHFVKPALTQYLTPMAEDIVTQIKQKGLLADQTGYDVLEGSSVKAHMASRPSDDAPQSAKLAWAQEGAQIPALRSLMVDYAKDQLMNEPERVSVRADRKEARAQTIAEAQRKQQEDLEYKRDRDVQQEQLRRDLARDSNDLRATLSHAVRAAASGTGDKASNYQIVQDTQGNAVRVNKLTGETTPLGAIGKESAGITKERQDQGEKVSNAKKSLTDLDEAELLLPQATGSLGGTIRDTIAGGAGYSTEAAKASARLDQIASALAGQVPKLGGATSDRDLMFYKEQVGNLGDRSKPVGVRLAALKQVRKFMERAADPTQYASPTGQPATPKGPTIREAVKSAVEKHTSGGWSIEEVK